METYDKLLIKIDLLSVKAIDKIQTCLELLADQGYIDRYPTLKETYENAIGIYNLERQDPDMWQLLCDHKVNDLFQMEGSTGISGIDQLHPTSVDDLAVLNSTIRLMAQEKGDEMPTEKLARFKTNPQLWIQETELYGLTQEQRDLLWPILKTSYGLCIAQEQFMQLVQLPELGGFSLTWADKLRKSIAKKNPKEYDELTKEFFRVTQEKGIPQNFAKYTWNVLIAMSKGYGFNQSHTLAYSLIGLQELNLAYHYPIIFWNCACLTSSAGGDTADCEMEDIDTNIVIPEIEYDNNLDAFEESDDDDDDDEEEIKKKKKKAKVKAIDYGKIASAIGKIQAAGVIVSPPNINKSLLGFYPDADNNRILYGFMGIARLNEDAARRIIAGRPYISFEDFLRRPDLKLNKLVMMNLIKAGAFDELDQRSAIMHKYILSIVDTKKELNLRNVQMLIRTNKFPLPEFEMAIKVFNFNKYISSFKEDKYFVVDQRAFPFYEQHFDIDLLSKGLEDGKYLISQEKWKKLFTPYQNKFRAYILAHKQELLEAVNNEAIDAEYKKYAEGTYAHWEMQSLSYYVSPHELAKAQLDSYGVESFADLSTEPDIERYVPVNGRDIPIYRIHRIAGTVLSRNKVKKTVTILTTDSVVTVKIWGDIFTQYDRQISEKAADGHKIIHENSWFKKGNQIIVTGIKINDSEFVAKKYKNTPYHLVELITQVNNGKVLTHTARWGEEE